MPRSSVILRISSHRETLPVTGKPTLPSFDRQRASGLFCAVKTEAIIRFHSERQEIFPHQPISTAMAKMMQQFSVLQIPPGMY